MKRKRTVPAKLTRPRLYGAYPRKRLIRMMSSAAGAPVLFITGPPGSGKTTLVGTYLDEKKLPCLWYQVDEGDSDPATFFYYMGLAAPGGRRRLPCLEPEYAGNLPVFARRFFENLYAGLENPSCIVLDNYQNVPPGSALHELVRHGIECLPEGIVMIMVSRASLPDALAGPAAEKKVRTVGWKELALTPEECGHIARLQIGRSLSGKEAGNLYDATHGWVAGLTLMVEHWKAGGSEKASPGPFVHERVFDYFAGEIFDRLDDGMKDFLLRTSFLPCMTPQTAKRLSGNGLSGRLLAELNRNNYFTEKRTAGRSTYQYHGLFGKFLRYRAEEHFTPKEVSVIRRRAAELMEESEMKERAVELYAEAGEWDQMTRLILELAGELAGQGRARTLESWIRRLPEQAVAKQPLLGYWLGVSLLPFDPVESLQCFERSFNRFGELGDDAGLLLAWSGAVDTLLYQWHDFKALDEWIAWLDGFLEKKAPFPSLDIEARVAGSMAGALMYRKIERPDVEEWFERGWMLANEVKDPALMAQTGLNYMYYNLWMGRPHKACVIMESLEGSVLSGNVPPLARILYHVNKAQVLLQLGRPGEGRKAIEQGFEIARKTGVHMSDSFLYGQIPYFALEARDNAEARKALQNLGAALKVGSRKLDWSHYHYLLAWEAWTRGDLPHAEAHAETCLDLAFEAGSPFPLVIARNAASMIRVDRGEELDARRFLDEATACARNAGSTVQEYHAALIEAHLLRRKGEKKKCLDALERALAIGEAHGYIHQPVWWRDADMGPLLCMAMEAGIGTDYAKALIRERRLVPDEPPLSCEAWPWPVKIHTLGRFLLEKDGTPASPARKTQKKPLELLKLLVAFKGRDVREDTLSDLLWKTADGDLAHKSFTTTLHRLRKLLGVGEAVRLKEGRLSFDDRRCWVDAMVFERVFDDAQELRKKNRSSEAAAMYERAMRLYGGHFLEDEGNARWAVPARERLQSKFETTVVKLSGHYEKAGDADRAAECLERGLEVDDLCETFYRNLMKCFLKEGRRSEAARVYRRCLDTFKAVRGAPPPDEIEALHASIREPAKKRT